MRIVLSDDAVADLDRLKLFLEEHDAQAAERAVRSLVNAINSLIVFPERGRMSALEGVRELVVPFGQSAYIVCYSVRREDQRISIVRIWHGRELRE